MEEIFEPRPSTSSEDIQVAPREATKSQTEDSSQANNWVNEPERGPRKLSIIPRTSQYERHPLLQERSASGLSQLEELTNILQRQKSIDIADCDVSPVEKPTASTNSVNSRTGVKPTIRHGSLDLKPEQAPSGHTKLMRLEPRGAFCEKHPLLEKSESGMSELEMYLMEKEQEMLLTSPVKEECVKNKTRTLNDRQAAINKPRSDNGGTQARRRQLQPRQNQYEKHALLESRDEQGLSPLDHFLHEKERLFIERIACEGAAIDQEEDSTGSKGKCSEKCVCKNATCVICKPNHSSSSPLINHSAKEQEGAVHKSDDGMVVDGTKAEESLKLDMKSPLINSGNLGEEIIDLRCYTDDVNKDNGNYNSAGDGVCDALETEITDIGQGQDSFDDMMRSHPPLMKKESSRETMIEPKETNKRVHFERTLSEKEREMRAISMTTDALDSQHPNQNTAVGGVSGGEGDEKRKKRFWSWWGRTSSSKLCQREAASQEGSPDCGGGRTTETVPLVEDCVTQQKDKNENNKKAHRKHCVIL